MKVSHAKLCAQLRSEVFVDLLVFPVLLPHFLVSIYACAHLCIDLASCKVLIVVGTHFKLFKVVVLFKEFVHFLLLLLIFDDGCSHLALRASAFAISIRHTEGVLCWVVVCRHYFSSKIG